MADITSVIMVNASNVLSDEEVAGSVPAFQLFDDTVLRPAWSLVPCVYSFMTWAQFEAAYRGADGELHWPDGTAPMFLNEHSTDPGALGFHEFDLNSVFGRVFVGDDVAYGVSPWVDASHEAFETRVDPLTNRTVPVPGGSGLALVEVGDPCEDDQFKIVMPAFPNYPMTDVVFPPYFGLPTAGVPGRYDYLGKLDGPCPKLLAGGYQSVLPEGASSWTQLTASLTPKAAWRIMSSRRAQRLAAFVPAAQP